MVNNYDRIASSYDRLSRLVFFKSQTNAQKEQLPYLPASSNILIVGGGTGWILEAIAQVHPGGLTITFVDISANMINLARKVNAGENKVFFIQGAIEDQVLEPIYDVVITAFLFDNFGSTRATEVFNKLDELLKHGGLWLFSDFSERPAHPWQSLLIKLMYAFFKYMAQVEASNLYNTSHLFQQQQDYQVIIQKQYYWKFITSTIYKKTRR